MSVPESTVPLKSPWYSTGEYIAAEICKREDEREKERGKSVGYDVSTEPVFLG